MPRGNVGERIPVDPRVVQEIQRNATMMQEQGGNFMSDWGGAQRYEQMAEAPREARMVYYSVIDGANTSEEIEVVTGLSSKEVTSGLGWLGKKGLVTGM